jgi:hypothetical protein
MLKGITVAVTIVTMLVASCSSSEDPNNGFSCATAKSKCPKDGMLPKEVCDALDDPNCGSVFLTLAICASEHQFCGADGKTDVDETMKACPSQYDKAQACADAHPPDGGK